MDKRNLALICLFSLAALAVNGTFQWWNDRQYASYLAQKSDYELRLQEQLRAQKLDARVPIDQLDIAYEAATSSWSIGFDQQLVVVGGSSAPQQRGLPLAGAIKGPVACGLYGEPNNQRWLHAVAHFPADGQVTLLGCIEGLFCSLSARVDEQMGVSELYHDLSDDLANKVQEGLVLTSLEGRAYPVATFKRTQEGYRIYPFSQEASVARQLKQATPLQIDTQERFYLLENPYLQLVISSKGGAVAEINLPFDSSSSASIVKQIETDKKLLASSPQNSQFPLRQAYRAADGSAVELVAPRQGGFYPLLRRGVVAGDGKIDGIDPKDYALALVSDLSDSSQLGYSLVELSSTKIVLEARQHHRRIRRTYSLPQDPQKEAYCFQAELAVEGNRSDLWISSGVPEAEIGHASPLPVLKYRLSRDQQVEIESFDHPKYSTLIDKVSPDWVCNGNAFFGLIIDPVGRSFKGLKIEPVSSEQVRSRLEFIGNLQPSQLTGYRLLLPLTATESTTRLRVVAAPMDSKLLKSLDLAYKEPKRGYDPHYRAILTFSGWFAFILRPFSNFMMVLLNLFHALTHSWAAAIFLLTVVLRLMLYPLNSWSGRSMRKMQQLTPKIQLLQDRYKNDPKRLQMEMVLLYKEHKVNPASGCLPIVIQIPFLFAMLHLFKTNFSLRGAPFIRGWIDDLAAPDVVLSWNYSLPLIGHQLHLLPILLGAAMFVQSLLMASSSTAATQSQRQQRAMSNVMTLAFTFMFYHLPAGLNLYWLTSSLLGIAQQWWQQRDSAKADLKR